MDTNLNGWPMTIHFGPDQDAEFNVYLQFAYHADGRTWYYDVNGDTVPVSRTRTGFSAAISGDQCTLADWTQAA